MRNQNSKIWRPLAIAVAVFLVVIIYAYGTEVTDVDLSELQEERRQESLVRVIRSLFRPDILEYDQEEVVAIAPIFVPCPDNDLLETSLSTEGSASLKISPGCASPDDIVHVEGFNLLPNSDGPLRFVPGNDPNSNVSIGRDLIVTDDTGYFEADITLPDRESEDMQYLRVTVRRNTGLPRFSESAYQTWGKIVETVFMALLATTIGTVLAVPLSFIAARNLMKSMRSPLASIALSVLGWVVGLTAGYYFGNWFSVFSEIYLTSTVVAAVSVIIVPISTVFAFRWAPVLESVNLSTIWIRLGRTLMFLTLLILVLFGIFSLAFLMERFGISMINALGVFGFLGNFLFHIGDILKTIAPFLFSFAFGGYMGGLLGGVGQKATEQLSDNVVKIINVLVTSLTASGILVLIGELVEWLYQINRPVFTFWMPLIFGVLIGGGFAFLSKPKNTLPIGMQIYFVTRSFLNALRSVEALVMAIVFVIAVGIGPFAGMLALGLHTIVSLAKLYSEQVENISTGPLEAIEATGANRLQTIVYAVIPQIVPPYIAYTLYRWDINVRMSTIIGFVGGGGIGFLLQQNINLLNYRGASTQMLAIAVVVASLDYVSSIVRERYT